MRKPLKNGTTTAAKIQHLVDKCYNIREIAETLEINEPYLAGYLRTLGIRTKAHRYMVRGVPTGKVDPNPPRTTKPWTPTANRFNRPDFPSIHTVWQRPQR